ncbi:MAG: ATP-binding protein [Candidatus Dependentiae bacterium]
MFKRNIKPVLEKALKRSPIVLLNGARQVGKSTLAKELLKEGGFNYLTFDDETVYLAAKSDPTSFIENIQKPVIIDEVQRVPELFLPIKKDIDNNRVPGRYLLTGSANPLLIPRLGDSLAGRMEIIDLMPLSQGEILGITETFIDTAFSDKPFKCPKKTLSKKELYHKVLVGGYPSVQGGDEEAVEAWMRSYINLLLQRDIKDLAQIEKLTELPNLLRVLAFRTSNLLNVAEVSREMKMVAPTVHRYIALLETIFIISLQLSWHTNLGLRFIKSPKVFFIDSGLLAYLLGINMERALIDSMQMGKVLENFIVGELKKQATWSKIKPEIHHLRTFEGKEVDIILEDRTGKIVGIEIKSGASVNASAFKGLKYLQEKVPDKLVKGIVLYGGSECVPFGKNMFALPINVLWE